MRIATDVSYAIRSLRRRPGFTAVALLTIGVAIAANTTMFSIVYATLIRPLPYRDPGALVVIESRAHTGNVVSSSIPNYRDWRSANRVFSGVAASAPWRFVLRGASEPRQVDSRIVLDDFFGVLGLTAARGRVIAPAEAPAHAGGARVAVVGHRFWMSQFGGSPALLGKTIDLDDAPYTVVGILPPEAGFPNADIDVYVPMATVPDLPWDSRMSGFGTTVFARLAPTASLAVAANDMTQLGASLRKTYGTAIAVPEVSTLAQATLGDVRQRLWLLMAAVTFVLLIAVTNVGNLMLAAGERRQHELAVRAALGAGRGDIVGLVLAESLVIGLAGGILGVALAYVTVGAAVPLLPASFPAIALARIHVDGVAALWGLGLAVLTTAVFGVGPGLTMSRGNTVAGLKSGARTVGGHRAWLREVLVISEVAFALILLVASGLMIRSLGQLLRVDKGFHAEHVLTGGIVPSKARVTTRDTWVAFNNALLDRVRAIPGVESAALTLMVPLSNRSWELLVHPEGVPPRDETGKSVLYNIVSPDYFATLGVRLVRGRGFTAADRDGESPVAVIDETMASQFWPGANALGKRVTFEKDSAGAPVYRTVVGLAQNVRHYELTSPSRVQVYVPMEQALARSKTNLRLIVRTAREPAEMVVPIKRALRELDPRAITLAVVPLQKNVDTATGATTAMTRVLGAFAVTALLLSAIGIFGVISYTVARRTREIGVRIALGAAPSTVMAWVVRGASRLAAIGLCIGVAAAVGFAQLLRHSMFEVSPIDPLTFSVALVLLSVVSVVAAMIPARRAARVDPVLALSRDE